MATLRFTSEKGPVALVPSAITAVVKEPDGIWIQDIHGEWWLVMDRTFDYVANEIDFDLRRSQS